MARFRSDLIAALIFLLLPLIYFFPVTVGGRTLIPADNLFAFEPWASARGEFGAYAPYSPHNDLLSDLLLENYPWKRFVISQLGSGELPLWNPHQFAGAPFLANGQHSALYPFSVLFYVMPLPSAYGWFVVSQLFLAGLFTYINLRSIGLSKLASLAGGLVYEFSLFMIVSVVFVMIIAGVVWLPLVLASIGWIVRQRAALGGRPASLPWVAIGGLAVGCQILAGHPEVIYYTMLVAGAYSATLLAQHAYERRSLRTALRPALYLLAMVVWGFAVGAAQLVPLFDVVRYNFRVGSATLEEVRGWAYPARHALAFIVPNVFGNPSHHGYFDLFSWQWQAVTNNALGEPILKIDWGIKNYVEGGAYMGILPLALAAIGLVSLRARFADSALRLRLIFFAVLGALSLAFAFGTPLYALIYYLPGLNQLHSPFRWVWILTLAVATLSAFGLDALRRADRTALTLARSLAALLTLCGAGTLAMLALVRFNFARFEAFISFLLRDLALAENAFADARMFFSYEAQWLAWLGLLCLGAAATLWLGIALKPNWGALAIGLIAADLLIAGYGFNSAADPSILTYEPPVVAFLKQDHSMWRFTSYDPDGQKPFNANVGWFFDLQDIRGYDSIIPKQYAEYMSLIQPQGELQYNRIAPINNPTSLDSPLLDLLNVKYVISLHEIENPKYSLVYDREVMVYENLGVSPRAFLLPTGCAFGAHFETAVKTFDPRRFAIFDTGIANLPAAPSLNSAACLPEAATITRYLGSEVFTDTPPANESYLILADSYFTDWRAFVRPVNADASAEREVPLLKVNGNFRAVRLAASDIGYTVRFKYSPNAVKFGGFASAISVLAMALAIGVWLWRYFYRESAEDSTARRVAKNSVAPMALNLMNRGIDLVFAAFMLRLLGPEDAGKYYFAGVLITWFEIWTNFGLNTYLTREVSRDRERANHYLSNTTLLRLTLGALSFPILAGVLFGLSRFSNVDADTALAIVLLAIGLAPSSISTGLTALFYGYEKAEYPAAITTVTTLLKVTFGALALLLGYSFIGLAAVTILVNTITMLILGVLAVRMFFMPRWDFSLPLQRTMIRESLPLMLNHLLATLFFKVDVTLLQPIRGAKEVGWYSTAYKFIEAYNIIPSFFTFALFPVMSRQAHEDRAALVRSYSLAIKLLVGVALPLAVVTTFLAESMIGLLAGDDFLPFGATALVLMVWSIPAGWINSVTNYVLIALGQQRALTRAFVIGLTFNIIGNLIFLPIYGFPAAAIITIFSEIVEGIPFYLTLRRTLAPISWPRLLWKLGASAGVMFAVTWWLWPLQPILALAVGGLLYLSLVVGLGVFEGDERGQLAKILPGGMRRRLEAIRWRPVIGQ